MLCASSDQGEKANDEEYPHDANPANIIRIGAAAATGNNAEYVNKNKKGTNSGLFIWADLFQPIRKQIDEVKHRQGETAKSLKKLEIEV
ncbi:Ff.00g065250.m01.CDS01 [Fusarium sp. VM40]|nr:Ff.00g065250.m01.CDS01 [Fusarium sp. VM40]